MKLNFSLLKETYAVCKFKTPAGLSELLAKEPFYSITHTEDEISVVCRQLLVPRDALSVNKDWRILKIAGPLDFSLVGILAGVSGILKENSIAIFTISTYETDYILVRSADLNKAVKALKEKGHTIVM